MTLNTIALANTFGEWVTEYNTTIARINSIAAASAYISAVNGTIGTFTSDVIGANTVNIATTLDVNGTVDFQGSANVLFGSGTTISILQANNLVIQGGSAGYFLKTIDGAGLVEWAEGSAVNDFTDLTGTIATGQFPPELTISSNTTFDGANIAFPPELTISSNTTFDGANVVFDSGTTISIDVTTAMLQGGAVTLEKIAPNARLLKTHRWTANGTANTFTVTTSPANSDGLIVSVSGIIQDSGTNYSVTGNVVTLFATPTSGEPVVIRTVGFTSNVSVVADQSVTTAKLAATAVTFAKIDNSWFTSTSNTTMVPGGRYFVDTDQAVAITMTTPINPTQGDWVQIIDSEGNASVKNITIGQDANSIAIQGANSDLVLTTDRVALKLVYFNTTHGWLRTEVI